MTTICDAQTESAGSDHACERKEEKPDKIPNEEKECDQALSRAVDDSHSIERTEGESSVERHGKKTADLVNDVPETDSDSHSRSDARRTASDQVIEQLDAQQQTGKSDSDVCEREIEDREEKADDSSNRSTIHPESEANEALPIHQTASQIIDEGETGHPDEEDSTVASSPELLAESHTQESVDQITSSSREQRNDAESNGDILNQDDVGQAESLDESSDSDWSCLDIIPMSAIRRGSPELVHESEEGQGVSRLLENALCPPGFEDITAESSTSRLQPSLPDLPTQTTEDTENRRTVEQSSLAGGALSQTEHNSSSNGRQTVQQVPINRLITTLTSHPQQGGIVLKASAQALLWRSIYKGYLDLLTKSLLDYEARTPDKERRAIDKVFKISIGQISRSQRQVKLFSSHSIDNDIKNRLIHKRVLF